MAAFEYRQAEEIRDTFKLHAVKFLFIGKSEAILLGFPDTTRVEVEGFPVCNIDDIVMSKKAANRQKDKESLPRLLSFSDWLKRAK